MNEDPENRYDDRHLWKRLDGVQARYPFKKSGSPGH